MENFKMTKLQITLTIDTESDDIKLEILNDFDDLTFSEYFYIFALRERLRKCLEVDLETVGEMLRIAKGVMQQKGISETPQED